MFFPGLHSNRSGNKKGVLPSYKKTLAVWVIALLVLQPLPLFAEGESSDTPPIVETGDAVAASDSNNAANVTDILPVPVEGSQEAETETIVPESTQEQATTTDISADVVNDAVVSNDTLTEAQTGENAVTGNGGEISTGNAYAAANVLNLVNVNVFDSYTLFLLLNHFFNLNGNVDFREWGAGQIPQNNNSPCGADVCSSGADGTLLLQASSTADVSNTVIVRASTGVNTGEGGDNTITTGNAYAGANVVNVVNTNIVDSNYLLFTFNNFGNLNGEIVFPSHHYFSDFFFNMGGLGTSASVSASNTASLENNISTEANTGDNNVIGGSGSSVDTGNAYGSTNLFNQVNTNLFGGGTFRILIRVHGSWLGQLFNVPEGVYWRETPLGIELYEGAFNSGSNLSPSLLNADVTNDASISNNVLVQALTGANEIGGGGDISSGHAYAGANVVNIANTNVFSHNWMLAIINIFGDWNGNLSFGQPDLWVGAWVEALNDEEGAGLKAGARVRLHITVTNRGDADASGIVVNSEFDKQFMIFENTYESSVAHRTTWTRDTLRAGETVELVYDGKIRGDMPLGWLPADGAITVTSLETDADPGDNVDKLSLLASHFAVGDGSGTRVTLTPDPEFKITKTHDVFFPTTGTTTANYKITIQNEGGIAHYATLYDQLKNEEGEVINEQSWDLGDIYPNEEITVTYTSVFSNGTSPGDYVNYATIRAIGRSAIVQPFYGAWFKEVATSTITILPPFNWAPGDEGSLTPETATSSVTSNLPGKDNSTQGKGSGLPQEVKDVAPPLSVPFSPLLFKVFAFRDSIITPQTPTNGGNQQANVFHAVSPKNLQDTVLLLLAFLLAIIISEALLSRTRLRNAFTSF